MVLSDIEIERRLQLPAGDPQRLVIEPFAPHTRPTGQPSYGLQSFGYDVRLGNTFVRFNPPIDAILRPGDAIPNVDWKLGPAMPGVLLRSGACALAETLEYIEMPHDCTALVQCKSTWARMFLNLNTTPLEAGWRGKITLEICNIGPLHIELRPGDGIGQVVFLRGDQPCRRPYSGPYQDQVGVTPPRVGG